MAKDFEDRLRAGGLGYGDLKKALFQHYWNYFAAARAKRAELAANLDFVNTVLAEGVCEGAVIGTDGPQTGQVGERIELMEAFCLPEKTNVSPCARATVL